MRRCAALGAVALLVLAGCSNGSDDSGAPASTSSPHAGHERCDEDLNIPEYEDQAAALGTHSQHMDIGAPEDDHEDGPQEWVPMMDASACQELRDELATTKEVAMQYPTVADAEAGGYEYASPYVDGFAAHYVNFDNMDGTFEVDEPEMLLYDGQGPDAHLVGVSYYLRDASEVEPTQGFTGPNDRYHRHLGLCVKGKVILGPENTSEETCTKLGGVKDDGRAGWMGHVWIIPGCESPWGLFSGQNPRLDQGVSKASGQPGSEGCSQTDFDAAATTDEGSTADD